jgi:hypothetical protein
MAVEEPRYSVERAEAGIELRQYPGFVVAETLVPGDFDSAGRTGFRRIAGYIFGNNVSPNGAAEKIAMTAPVTMEPTGERIAMTAPATAQADQWRRRGLAHPFRDACLIPARLDLPRPLDPLVHVARGAGAPCRGHHLQRLDRRAPASPTTPRSCRHG